MDDSLPWDVSHEGHKGEKRRSYCPEREDSYEALSKRTSGGDSSS